MDRESISARCYDLMLGSHRDISSIAGPGTLVWDYTLTEFAGDWSRATDAVDTARERMKRYDCVMINGDLQGDKTVRLSAVFRAFKKYRRYHLMACR